MPRSKLAIVNAILVLIEGGVCLTLNAGTRAKMGRLAHHRGYTITAFVEELIKRVERPVTARLPSS
jgi:hypothetical protein